MLHNRSLTLLQPTDRRPVFNVAGDARSRACCGGWANKNNDAPTTPPKQHRARCTTAPVHRSTSHGHVSPLPCHPALRAEFDAGGGVRIDDILIRCQTESPPTGSVAAIALSDWRNCHGQFLKKVFHRHYLLVLIVPIYHVMCALET